MASPAAINESCGGVESRHAAPVGSRKASDRKAWSGEPGGPSGTTNQITEPEVAPGPHDALPTARTIRIEDVAAGLTTVEAVNERIREYITKAGLLRQYRTKLRRAARASVMADVRRDFEKGMDRPAICRKHHITLGQLTGCANRGGWKCDTRSAGRKAAVSQDQLPAMKAAYETDPSMVKVIAGRFNICAETLRRYAVRGKWVRLGAYVGMPAATASQVPA